MKYIEVDHLKAEMKNIISTVKNRNNPDPFGTLEQCLAAAEILALELALETINSLQQEPTPDTDVLHTELVNLLKTYRIGEETARTMADRIADTYGAQRYMDGLCDGLDEEDTKQEQGSVAERFARIVRGNLIGIDKEVQQKFEQLYFEVTGNKMYGGYND